MTTEEKIWQRLKAAGYNDFGIAGLMGNLYAESALSPTNLQNTYEKKLGMNDAAYTAAVDKGTYANFAKDCAGYGLAQWTFPTRKKALLDFAKSKGKSIGDLDMQLDFLIKEIAGYSGVCSTLKSAKSVRAASDKVLLEFERPADQSEAVKIRRASYGQKYYDKYSGATPKEEPTMSFKPRLSRPEAGNKYYITKSAGGYSDAIKGSPTDAACNVLSNCVGYAYGRFNEIGGYGCCKYLRPVNAENFMQYAGGLATGQTPKLGACMVWRKGATLNGSDGAGHVAIVEKIISAAEVVTSESGYGSKTPFWTKTRKKGNGNWGAGSGYTFLGFIYNPAVKDGATVESASSAASVQTATITKMAAAPLRDSSAKGGKRFATTENLNLRYGPSAEKIAGTTKDKYGIITTLGKGTGVMWYGFYAVTNGVKWFYVAAGSKTGWVSSAYLK